MDPYAEYKGGCPPGPLPKPSPGCPHSLTVNVPGLTEKDAASLKTLQRAPCPGPPDYINESEITGLWLTPVSGGPIQDLSRFLSSRKKHTITFMDDVGSHRPTDFVVRRNPDGDREVLVNEVDLAKGKERMKWMFTPDTNPDPDWKYVTYYDAVRDLGDKFLGAVDQIKERRKKIDQIDRTIRLINTVDSAGRAVTRFAEALSGKEQPLKDDYNRLHGSIMDTLVSQKNYLQMLNEQSIDSGRTVNAAPQDHLVVTFEEEKAQFIHACLFEIQDLKEQKTKIMDQMTAREKQVDEYMKKSIWEKNRMEAKMESMEVEIKARIMTAERHNDVVNSLNKTIAGLRSAITRMGGKTRPPRKRKK